MKAVFRLLCFCLIALASRAESGAGAWLRYAPLEPGAESRYATLPAVVVAPERSIVIETAKAELIRGVRGMLGRTLRVEAALPRENSILLVTAASLARFAPGAALPSADGSYVLKRVASNGHAVLLVAGRGERGVLYGVFALLRHIALGESLAALDEAQAPYAPLRWTNEWENLDGTIERGYAGRAIFFDAGHVAADLSRAAAYARLLASVGINGCAVNNVNANPRVLTQEMLPELARLAAAMRPYGVRIALAVPFGAPKTVGGLDSFDPLDARVGAWWKALADEIYRAIPDLAGFLVKADSEGQAGPSAYARALAPHGGVLLYRGFVYDHHLDWRNPRNDRARAAYDNFHDLDGRFDANAVVQLKHGPIDFQVREPVNPAFAVLRQTSTVLEVQVTQEYTGQQRHLCYLVPMWKQALDFDLRAGGRATTVKEIVSGRAFPHSTGGFAAVANVGLDNNWLGHDLAMVNLYGYGRLAWDPELSATAIAEEWTRQSFGSDPRVVSTITALEMDSWLAYENYTGPLGGGGLTDIIGVHFGPGIESSERNGWGQWHRADASGMGMDRTSATGTGYIAQYPPEVAARYESLATCPDELLLFLHHVPYTHVLHSGKTVIQHIYDTHYLGAAQAAEFVERWRSLRGLVDEQRYAAVLARLEFQAAHAVVWRDAVCEWFLKRSGIADERNRAGHHPERVEAESLALEGYAPVAVTPWETASQGTAVTCPEARCTATLHFAGEPGWYTLGVEYFDVHPGVARYSVRVNGQPIDAWDAALELPSRQLDGHTSTRRTIRGVALRAGDALVIEGQPGGEDRAALDYIELHRER
jgi:alpha-glucuronidase